MSIIVILFWFIHVCWWHDQWKREWRNRKKTAAGRVTILATYTRSWSDVILRIWKPRLRLQRSLAFPALKLPDWSMRRSNRNTWGLSSLSSKRWMKKSLIIYGKNFIWKMQLFFQLLNPGRRKKNSITNWVKSPLNILCNLFMKIWKWGSPGDVYYQARSVSWASCLL